MGYGTLTDPFTDPSRAVGYGDAKFMRDGPFKGAWVRMCEDRCIPASTNKRADDLKWPEASTRNIVERKP